MRANVLHGDCLDRLRLLESSSADSLVTDPPAGISFMGRGWDGDKGGRRQWVAYMAERFAECLRVLKPGAHGVVWALPRTSHWTATALEDAGFEVRDVVVHMFGTGFPKSLDVGKAIDASAGVRRGSDYEPNDLNTTHGKGWGGGHTTQSDPAVTDAAKQWDGWGTALKPASEHWVLVRKPLEGTVAANVLEHGTGALNIDACRIGYTGAADKASATPQGRVTAANAGSVPNVEGAARKEFDRPEQLGRWPANVVLDPEAGAMLDEQSGESASGVAVQRNVGAGQIFGDGRRSSPGPDLGYGDTGGASRFFYCAKPSTAERGAGLYYRNDHETVKSVDLCRWLSRLVTPPGGLVLDPFTGSGSVGIASTLEGFRYQGIEQQAEHVATARFRIEHWMRHGEMAVEAATTRAKRQDDDARSGQTEMFE